MMNLISKLKKSIKMRKVKNNSPIHKEMKLNKDQKMMMRCQKDIKK